MIPRLSIPTHVNVIAVNQPHGSASVINHPSSKHRIALLSKIAWACVICVCTSFSQSSHGTIVVLLVRDTVAFIGADSRSLMKDGSTLDIYCKIAACGNRIVGCSGIGLLSDPQITTQSAIIEIMRNFPNDSVSQCLVRLEDTFASTLLNYRETSGAPDSMNTFGFVGAEYVNGGFNITLATYVLTASGTEPRLLRRRDHRRNQHFGLYYDGLTDSIHAMSKQDTLMGKSGDPIALINKLIAIQASRYPRNIGGQTDIVELSKNGVRWIQHKKECKTCTEF